MKHMRQYLGICLDNHLWPVQCQVNIWTNAGLLLVGNLRTNLKEILIKLQWFSLKKINLDVSTAKWRPFCHGLSMLSYRIHIKPRWTLCSENEKITWHVSDQITGTENTWSRNTYSTHIKSEWKWSDTVSYVMLHKYRLKTEARNESLGEIF